MTPVDVERYERLAAQKAARQHEVLELVAADHRRRPGPPRLAARATGMPPRNPKDRR